MPAERVKAAVEAGAAALGENRVQEAKDKIEALGHPVPWHLIGHLQTNKAKDAVRLFDCIQSVDRLDLAREIDRRAEAAGRTVDVLVEVNLGEESQKGGARPDEVKALLDAMAGARPHARPRADGDSARGATIPKRRARTSGGCASCATWPGSSTCRWA